MHFLPLCYRSTKHLVNYSDISAVGSLPAMLSLNNKLQAHQHDEVFCLVIFNFYTKFPYGIIIGKEKTFQHD